MNATTGWCEGCARSLDEIAGWSRMTDADKRQVWLALPQRRLQLQAIEDLAFQAPKAADEDA
ncbi:MAG: DUF1289 domain-containing protein [Rubrivivax sp.]|nr:DUF1289 domain-containing protein [Rubrivivax sp.]